MALRGMNITDDEYVETFSLDPSVANKPIINTVMLNKVKQENVDSGMDEAEAEKIRSSSEKEIKRLLAQNGML